MRFASTCIAFALAALAPAFAAGLELPAVLSDGLVLQKGKPVRLWGSANPKEQVTVSWGKDKRSTTASATGQWRIELPAVDQSAGDIVVTGSAGGQATIRDVQVGQVWICGGQSNMMLALQRTDGASVAGKPLAAPASLRLYRLPAPGRTRNVEGRWAQDAPAVASEFSAVCYLTGRMLAEASRGPVGLIDTSAGGTSVEAWTPEAATAGQPARRAQSKSAMRAQGAAFDTLARPVAPLSAAGVLWYQGEANRRNPQGYAETFAAAMDGWRRAFEQPELPVFYMQLPAYPRAQPQAGWEAIRSEQARAEKLLPRLYMVPSDGLVASELHPANKMDYAKRFFERINSVPR